MAVHLIHIGKTGGTAVKRAVRRVAGRKTHLTPHGELALHRHAFGLMDIERADFALFCVRDPLTRYLSGFYSRLRKGQPRYYFEWTDDERVAFEAFPTPQLLATGLASRDEDVRAAAVQAMRRVRHLRPMKRWLTSPEFLEENLSRIVYIARQETLNADWPQMRAVLGLPEHIDLPTDSVRAHRHDPDEDWHLDETARAALLEWYAMDVRLLDYCDGLRARRGWGAEVTEETGSWR